VPETYSENNKGLNNKAKRNETSKKLLKMPARGISSRIRVKLRLKIEDDCSFKGEVRHRDLRGDFQQSQPTR
jgi:hypothetical protein